MLCEFTSVGALGVKEREGVGLFEGRGKERRERILL